MSGISIISNFNLNQNAPLDYRIVAYNDAAKSAIPYKYDGMKVFQQDNRLTYTWNSNTSSWEGDMSFLENGYLPMFISPGLTNSSIYEGTFSNADEEIVTGLQINTDFYLPLLAKTYSPSTNNIYSFTMIDYNGLAHSIGISSANNDGDAKSIGVGFGNVYHLTSSDKLRTMINPLYATGSFVGINSSSSSTASTPKGNLQINGSSTTHPPILIDISGSGTIAYNWYSSGGSEYTFNGDGCSGIRFDTNGTMKFNAFYGITPSMSGVSYMMAIDPVGVILMSGGRIMPSSGIYYQIGNIYADIHNTGGTQSFIYPSISSGTYISNATSEVNCSLISDSYPSWSRVGNVVTVSGSVKVDPMTASTITSFRLSLPISATFSTYDSYKLNGVGKFVLTSGSGDVCAIQGSSNGTSTAYFYFYATQTSSMKVSYIYQYLLSEMDNH